MKCPTCKRNARASHCRFHAHKNGKGELCMSSFERIPDDDAEQSVQRTCAQCGADDWRDAIIPDTVEICNRCGASR